MSKKLFKLKKVNIRDKELIYNDDFQKSINESNCIAQEIFVNTHLKHLNKYVTSGEIIYDFTKINIPKYELDFNKRVQYLWIREGFNISMKLPDATLEEMLNILNDLCNKIFPIKNESN